MPGILDWLGIGGATPVPGGTLGPIAPPTKTPYGDVTAPNAIQPSDIAPPNFWSQDNQDGTSNYLGGLIRYDPAKDEGSGDRLGLFGAAMQDAAAQLSGRPEYATNLQRYSQLRKQQVWQQLISQILGGISGQSSVPAAQAVTTRTLPSLMPGGSPMQLDTTLPTLPGQSTPAASGAESSQDFSLQAMAPRLAAMAAQGFDVSPVVNLLKDVQPKYSQTVNFTADGRPYVAGDNGTVKFLDQTITPRDKMEVAPNGQAYDPFATKPGAVFNDPSKPFGLGADGKSVANQADQDFEIRKAGASAQIRADSAQNVDPKAVDLGIQYFLGNGGKMPPTARSPALQQAIMAGANDRMQAAGITMDDLVNKGIGIHSRASAATTLGRQQAGTMVNEDTVNGGIKILNGLLAKGAAGPTKITGLNDLEQWAGRQTNNPDAANLKNAVSTISNEYARVMTGQTNGSASSDSARNEAAHRLLLGYNSGTMQAVTAQMQAEMRQRSDAYSNALGQTTGGSYRGVKSNSTNPLPSPQSLPRLNASPIKIQSDADYNRLPSGAMFVGPDGQQRRKP